MASRKRTVEPDDGTTPVELGVAVRVPLADVTIAEAMDLVEDGQLWVNSRMVILSSFPQVTVEGYWDLTVKDHAEMLAYIQEREPARGS